MPEGPEVRTVASTIRDKTIGLELKDLEHSDYPLRKPVDYQALKRLSGQKISDIDSYGKVLFIYSDNIPIIYCQLGMTGQLTVNSPNDNIKPHTHMRWKLSGGVELRYVDPRRFGMLGSCDEKGKQGIINRLGPDPFALKEKDIKMLITSMSKSKRNIKEVLLDQSVIAGVGNIYASEALFLARIDPRRLGCDISAHEYQRLISSVVDVMEQAFNNCGTSFSNYVDGSGKKGDNLNFLQVFQRHGQECFSCGQMIKRIKQSGRSTFFCPLCQTT